MALKIKDHGSPYTALEMCRVRRVHGEVKAGALLAYYGAWDRKALVESVTYLGKQPSKYNAEKLEHTWAVKIRRLGNFYSDGTVIWSNVRSQEIFLQSTDPTNHELLNGRANGWKLVEPLPPEDVVKGKHLSAGQKSLAPPKLVVKKRPKAVKTVYVQFTPTTPPVKLAPPPPEAILSKFLVN